MSRVAHVLAFVLLLTSASSGQIQETPPSTSKAEFTARLVAAAVERANHVVRYVPGYVRMDYPNGDVPADTGVCSDEIIRTFRAVGIDLQKEVHEDMLAHFADYSKKWGARRPDKNIDHRRVPNLMVFFKRHGEELPITKVATDYLPGDIVTWDLGGDVAHIGIVVDRQPFWTSHNLVLHNIGQGPKIEDVLFDWEITGHYRYYGPSSH